jgi:hypothetical protein
MADEEIPEKVDLAFLARQGKRILDELKDMRADNQERDRKLDEIAIGVAALSVDLKATKETVEQIHEIQQNQGARLNVIDGRLAIIERHTGLVKA